MKTVYVLMMLASGPTGWQVAPIEGNPYKSFADCTVIRNVLTRNKVFRWGDLHISKYRCTPRQVRK